MQFREHRLENGLEIVAECNPKAYSAALAFFVNTGARDEHDEISGVSHFLEHMVFKGTPTRDYRAINRAFEEQLRATPAHWLWGHPRWGDVFMDIPAQPLVTPPPGS